MASTSAEPVASTSAEPMASTSAEPVASTRAEPVASTSMESVAATPVSNSTTDAAESSRSSVAKRKLELLHSHAEASSRAKDVPTAASYRIVDINILKKMIDVLCCSSCTGGKVELVEETIYGLASRMELRCTSCEDVLFSQFTSDKTSNSRALDVNSRFVFSCKANGLGYEQAKSVMTDMNIPPPISDTAFTSKLSSLEKSCEAALHEHLQAVHELVRTEYVKEGYASSDDEKIDIAVSYDGTWQKRGHTSHNGIGIAIDILTGYVVDFEVLSNLCIYCEKQKQIEDDMPLSSLKRASERHEGKCQRNYDGSSNAMEVEAAKRIWLRSVESRLQYTTMLSDGDSKAFDAVSMLKPYGATPIKKEECINHVAKRLTAGLESLKAKGGPGGISLGGRGMLTKGTIGLLHSYYHNAIKKNAGDVQAMRRAIMAAPHHITSTDAKHDHSYCPENGWCWFKNPTTTQTNHKPDLPHQMLEIILPLYKRLSSDELLERCARVATQNANECVNGVIWKNCPKTQWSDRRSVMIGATMGVMTFNGGTTELERVQRKFGLVIGEQTVRRSSVKDRKRSLRRIVSSSKRKARAHRRQTERDRQIRKEGVTYAAGRFGA